MKLLGRDPGPLVPLASFVIGAVSSRRGGSMHQHLRRVLCAITLLIVPAGLALNARAEKTPPTSDSTRAANGALVIALTPRTSSGQVATVTLTKAAPAKALATKASTTGASYLRYTVQSGDTLSSIGERYDVKIREIKLATGISEDALKLGQVLRVPLTSGLTAKAQSTSIRLPPGVIVYTVKAKESLSNIRARYDVSEADIINANPSLVSLDHLKPGSSLLVPTTQKGRLIRLPKGMSLLTVAAKLGVPLTKLVSVNGLRDPRELTAGAVVLVPGVQDKASRDRLEKKRAAEQRHEIVMAAQAETKAKAKVQAKAQAKLQARAQAKLEAKRDALRVKQRAAVATAQRASIRVIPDQVSSIGGYRWPMRSFQITSGYGRRSFWIGRSNFHTGIDLAARYGAPIYAAKAGYVTEAGWGKFGLNVRVSTGRSVSNIYGHMSRLRVRNGEFVNRGELIGYEGCTGICTGSHLHFEVQVSGAPRNPLRFLP
jgi:murein DD-endopeptidase MepM/ murein hydrolase activator NlpD